MKIERHVFVCQNERPEAGRPSCMARGAAEVLAALQRAVASDPEAAAAVAVTPCGCLGPCFEGPVVVVYPEGVWYAPVTGEDALAIANQHLKGGEPVARLRLEREE